MQRQHQNEFQIFRNDLVLSISKAKDGATYLRKDFGVHREGDGGRLACSALDEDIVAARPRRHDAIRDSSSFQIVVTQCFRNAL